MAESFGMQLVNSGSAVREAFHRDPWTVKSGMRGSAPIGRLSCSSRSGIVGPPAICAWKDRTLLTTRYGIHLCSIQV